MGLMEFIILVLCVGLVVWLVNTYAPIPQQFKTLILIASIIVLVVILLKAMGIFGFDTQIPKLR